MEGIIESMDEFFSANLAQEIVRGMRESASRGFYMASRAPFGYRRVKVLDGAKERPTLQLDPQTAPVVRRMFDDFIVARGLKDVTQALNEEGIASPTGRQWNKTVVHKILVNKAYLGVLVWGRRSKSSQAQSPIVVEGAWEPLVSKEIFEQTQAILKSRRFLEAHPRRTASRFLLSGLVKCGDCRRLFSGKQAKSGKFAYYVCGSLLHKGSGACSAPYLSVGKLEGLVLDRIKNFVLQEEHLEGLVKMVEADIGSAGADRSSRRDAIEVEIKDVGQRLSRLYDALETGQLTLDDLAPRIRSLRDRQHQLQGSKAAIGDEVHHDKQYVVNLETVRRHVGELRSLLDEGTIGEQREFIRSFVTEIVIREGEATMKYRVPLPRSADPLGPAEEVLPIVPSGGAGGTRTPYLLNAIEALSQLSYSPTEYGWTHRSTWVQL